ncbi:hypothetical protein MSAR_01220 [Mycolicibacterium sarraceniae]|uniref:Uncharacterized protein n=1 Tax=Mycolicibacterium sarraceniae TaxID=1534348 RepID=A0A7I7SM39_9MYCO|nr:hypothetical protein MSAR_01220 [Mycolicibacterium sarraceniae]
MRESVLFTYKFAPLLRAGAAERADRPAEMTNLVTTRGDNAELVLAASSKLEEVIRAEIGVDDGREIPCGTSTGGSTGLIRDLWSRAGASQERQQQISEPPWAFNLRHVADPVQ